MLCMVTQCTRHVSLNTSHQLHWGGQKMGTGISCRLCTFFICPLHWTMYVLCTGDHSVEREAWSYWCWCQSGNVWRRSRDSRIGRWSVCELHNGPGYKLVVLATHSDDCVVLTGRFRHSLVTSVAFLLCVWHVMFKESLQFEQNVVEMLPSLVKLVISFQKAYKSVFLVRFVVLTYLEFLGCMLVVETPGM